MAKLFRPRLFSQQFGINHAALQKAGLLDPFLNADTKLFVEARSRSDRCPVQAFG
jgi:hypothetical protein